ncbi:3-hydroxyacyl-CoA dehydrogenase family protein [Chitinophaga defluvii]|uniref:3-hydroxyacyl-CoA dehydrogenase family protein n=1 Tax=Chitinophaga defluvii TaxID=3163343 RepID=A0ABV2SZ09_9BACT
MRAKYIPADICIGVVGLGLMGSSIVVALLAAGHPVKAIAPLPAEEAEAPARILAQLQHCAAAGLLEAPIEDYQARLIISGDYHQLKDCRLVLECVIEKQDIKALVYRRITDVVSDDAVISSNTSAIPISVLQEQVLHPERFLGIHWAEPAYATRFLEITCGVQTAAKYADWVYELSRCWGKEATLLRKDIRGFITNRLMYAVYREALSLVADQRATLEDVDKSFRYDTGSWITLMGIFRRMDFNGISDYAAIFRTIFPTLSNSEEVPMLMQRMVDIHAKGIHNQKGLYEYTAAEAREWEAAFALFNRDICQLAALYPEEELHATESNGQSL